jgi:hypothetical protein
MIQGTFTTVMRGKSANTERFPKRRLNEETPAGILTCKWKFERVALATYAFHCTHPPVSWEGERRPGGVGKWEPKVHALRERRHTPVGQLHPVSHG